MSSRRFRWSLSAPVWALAALLSGCGGGGGGDAGAPSPPVQSGPPAVPSPSPSDPTTPPPATPAPPTTPAPPADPVPPPAPPPRPASPVVQFPSPASSALITEGDAAAFAADAWWAVSEPVALADELFLSIRRFAPGVIDETLNGTVSGTVRVRGVREPNVGTAASGWLSFEFNGYSDGGARLDGQALQIGTDTHNGVAHDVLFELTALQVTMNGRTFVGTGTIDDMIDISLATNGRETTSNLELRDVTGSEHWWLEAVQTRRRRTFAFSGAAEYSGRLHFGARGYVALSSDAPYDFISNEQRPDRGGALRLSGKVATAGLVAVNEDYVAVVFDADGDLVDETFARRPWAQLLPAQRADTASRAVANAGANINVGVGETVRLEGLLSHDGDGSFIRAEWAMAAMPVGSQAVLDVSKPLTPSFVPDVPGSYLFTVRAIDPDGDDHDAVEVRVAPSAWAGDYRVRVRMDRPRSMGVGQALLLDAGMSRREDLSDSGPLDVLYDWSSTGPWGSTAALSHPTSATTAFVPDRAGFFAFRVRNGVNSPSYAGEAYKVVGVGTGFEFFEQANIETGGGNFADPVAADFDGDGDVDIASIGYSPTSSNWVMRVFLATGPGRFTEAAGFSIADNSFYQLLYGDVDGDGFGDLVTISADTLHIAYLGANVPSAPLRHVALGRGPACGFGNSLYGALSDVNGDGASEVLLADRCLLEMQTWTHTSGGNLGVLRRQSIPALAGVPIVFGDLSGDGRTDFVTQLVPGFPTNPETLLVFVQGTNGTFASSQSFQTTGTFSVGDVSGDGRDDLLAVDAPTLRVFRQNSSGLLLPPVDYTIDAWLSSEPRFADLNGDGRGDFVAATGVTQTLLLGLAQPNGSLSFLYLPEKLPFGADGSVVPADIDGDGRIDLLRRRVYFTETGFALRLQKP